MNPILNIRDVELERVTHGDRFDSEDGPVAVRVGAKDLGYSVTVVPPGKRASPFHCHHNNEEMFLVLEGTGTLRFAGHEYPVKEGDVICAPAGGKETAHQLVNTSDSVLKYLNVSTMNAVDVIEYPDSGKTAVYVGGAPGTDGNTRTMNYRGRLGPKLDYWEGE